MRRNNTSVEPAVGHNDNRFSDTAKHCNDLGLRHLLSADKQLKFLDPKISLPACFMYNRLLF